MRILAIDTASDAATVAVTEDKLLLGEYTLNHRKTHSQKIMVMVERLLGDLELEVADIDLFAAASGPGSFTGLRIGVATVKALAHSVNKPVVPVGTLEGIAYNIPFAKKPICVIMDARRRFVFNAVYKAENGVLTEVTAPNVCYVEERVKALSETGAVFAGDGVNLYADEITEALGDKAEFAPVHLRMSRASSVAYAAALKAEKGETMKYSELVPEYIRLSQAEQELLKKQNGGH